MAQIKVNIVKGQHELWSKDTPMSKLLIHICIAGIFINHILCDFEFFLLSVKCSTIIFWKIQIYDPEESGTNFSVHSVIQWNDSHVDVSITAIVGQRQSGDKVTLFLAHSFKIIFKITSISPVASIHSHFILLSFSLAFPFSSSSLLLPLSQFIFSSWIIPWLNLDQPSAALRYYTYTNSHKRLDFA